VATEEEKRRILNKMVQRAPERKTQDKVLDIKNARDQGKKK